MTIAIRMGESMVTGIGKAKWVSVWLTTTRIRTFNVKLNIY